MRSSITRRLTLRVGVSVPLATLHSSPSVVLTSSVPQTAGAAVSWAATRPGSPPPPPAPAPAPTVAVIVTVTEPPAGTTPFQVTVLVPTVAAAVPWLFRGAGSTVSGAICDHPNCGPDFTRRQYDSRVIRYYEDGTQLSRAVNQGTDPIGAPLAARMTRCGVDLVGLDFLAPGDPRLARATWQLIGSRVDVRMPIDELRRIATDRGVEVKDDYGPGKLVLEIYEKTTEHALWGPVFVCDYPREVSPLARPHQPGYAQLGDCRRPHLRHAVPVVECRYGSYRLDHHSDA